MMNKKHPLLLVVSGPSGSGKGSMLGKYLESAADTFYSISATTRNMRPGEVDGVNYHFVSEEEFKARIEKDAMLEYARYCDHYYGTPKAPVEENLAAGRDVILELDVAGAMKIKKIRPDGIFIFTLPPSMEILRKRLVGRNTEEEDVIAKRLQVAVEEIRQAHCYDYIVVNDDLDAAVRDFAGIVAAEKARTERNQNFIDEVFFQ